MSPRSLLQTVFCLCACLSATFVARADTDLQAGVAPLRPGIPTLFVAGDSTAAKSPQPEQQGWAEPFAQYFDPARMNVANRARGGRSSRTFITEGHWQALLQELRKGDVVLLQFGHNDAGALNEEPPGSTRPLRARGTIPGIGEETQAIDNVVTGKHEVVHSFGWYLRQMIADVRARQATPIVVTLTLRNEWNDGRIQCGSGDYRIWDQQVARAAGVAFVDLSRILADRYQQLGSAEALQRFFLPDNIHTTPEGAAFNAAAVVAGLKQAAPDLFNASLSEQGRNVQPDHTSAAASSCAPLLD
jgi:lysophospholipase L1-like esterase